MNFFARKPALLIFFSVAILTISAMRADAQQTIFNVPSADILDKGKVYLELDATFRFNDTRSLNKFSSAVLRAVVGTGGNVEIGLNLTGNINPGADATTLASAVKWRAYNNDEKGLAIVVGDNLLVPVRNKTYRVGNYAYAQISKTIKETNGTRLTAGGYYFTKKVVSKAARGGGQFSLEQPVNKSLTVAADWFTGRHSAGYFTPGVIFKPHPRLTGYLGYSIGNDNPHSNNFFFAALGVNLN